MPSQSPRQLRRQLDVGQVLS